MLTSHDRAVLRDLKLQPLWLLFSYVALGITLLHPSDSEAQSRLLRPPTHGAREVRASFITPRDAQNYVAGHAVLLRDSGGLVAELTGHCASGRADSDSGQLAVRQRLAALELRRVRVELPRFDFGSVPPGEYLVLAWIEFQWPRSPDGTEAQAARQLGVDRTVVSVGTDSAVVLFTGPRGFPAQVRQSQALHCLEFLVRPSDAERIVTPVPRRPTRQARQARPA